MKKNIIAALLLLALIPAGLDSKDIPKKEIKDTKETKEKKTAKEIWQVSSNQDIMTDEITKIYIASINDNFSIVLFDAGDDKKIDTIKFFFGSRYLNSGDDSIFYIRFDKNEAKEMTVYYEGAAAFINSEEEIQTVLTDMIASKTMAIRALSYEGRQNDEVINLEPLKPGLKQFMKIYEQTEENNTSGENGQDTSK